MMDVLTNRVVVIILQYMHKASRTLYTMIYVKTGKNKDKLKEVQ